MQFSPLPLFRHAQIYAINDQSPRFSENSHFKFHAIGFAVINAGPFGRLVHQKFEVRFPGVGIKFYYLETLEMLVFNFIQNLNNYKN